jgi:prepilin-type N-terminal cleavage/methylation domain-containing protein
MVYAQPPQNNLKSSFNYSGFTFIELMVVILITATLSVLGIASYSNYNDTQRLKQAAYTLKNNLRLAQTNATSANVPSGCTAQTFLGYTVSFTNGPPAGYTITPNCNPAQTGKTYEIVNDIRFDSLPATFTFKPLTAGTSSAVSIVITLSGIGTRQYQIQVNPNGSIVDLGFSH